MHKSLNFLMCGYLLFAAAQAMAAPVAAPRSFEAIAYSETSIKLFWLPSVDSGITGYLLKKDGVSLAELVATATDYNDSNITANSTHTYTIVALRGQETSSVRTYVERSMAPWPSNKTAKRNSRTFESYDVLVVQASTGGVAAAIEAARRHLKVALIEPSTRVGGMPANGLSATDLRRAEHASGFFVRFRDRVKSLYASDGITADGMSYEPRVAHQAMKSLLYDTPGITLFRRARPTGVVSHRNDDGDDNGTKHLDGVTIEELKTDGKPTGRTAYLKGSVIIDSTDSGDIAAWAGAPFLLGRESRSAREPHNGVIYYDRANDKLLPGSTGRADKRLMAYSYLLTVKDYGAGEDKSIPMPAGYRKEDFIHTPAWKDSWAFTSGRMPGSKLELNQHPQGGDIQEINYRYPISSYAERMRIENLYREHVLGYLYYIQTEQGQKQVGLPDDEYRDTGGFPPLLYVREGRRILGDQFPDETDVTNATTYSRPESVGIGDYPMDSHAVRVKTNWTTPDMGEGEWWLYKQTPIHQLPFGVMAARSLDNVLVTTAVSSTHVSFGTYRLEPARMAFGEAAGVAADLCIRFKLSTHQVPVRQVQDALLPHVANLTPDPAVRLSYYTDLKTDRPSYRAIQYLTAHGVRLPGDTFKPDAVTTAGEFAILMQQLADRTCIGNEYSDADLVHAYLGYPAAHNAVSDFKAAHQASVALTRGMLAHWLPTLLPAQLDAVTLTKSHYSDSPLSSDAERLFAMGIDSVLWDSWTAFDPDGKLLFRPEISVTHEQLYAALYIAQIGIGPMFDDLPTEIALRVQHH